MQMGPEMRCEIKVKTGSTPTVHLKDKIVLELPLKWRWGKEEDKRELQFNERIRHFYSYRIIKSLGQFESEFYYPHFTDD